MNFSVISSSSDDDEDNIPFAERAAKKAFGKKATLNRSSPRKKKRSPCHAFSDSDSDTLPSPKKARGSIVLTPPPVYIPSPLPPREQPNHGLQDPLDPWSDEDLPDTEEFLSRQSSVSSSSSLVKVNSGKSTVSTKERKTSNKENKEAEKLRKQEEKRKIKEAKELQRQGSKQQKEIEKIIARQTRKEEVNNYIVVVIDPQVASSPPGPEILSQLRQPTNGKPECVFQYVIETQPVPGLVSWRRKIVSQGSNGQLEEAWEEEDRCLLYISAEEVASHVLSSRLRDWASQCKDKVGGRHLTLVVYGLQAYFRAGQNAKERARKAAVRKEVPGGKGKECQQRASQYSVEEGLVGLSVERVCDHLTYDSVPGSGWRLCAGVVFHHTRAVAEAPFKIKKGLSGSGGFNFWAKADSKDCVAPKALSEYWKAVIMQVSSGAGLEKASAIASNYSSPSLLLKAYSQCTDHKEAELLLAGMEVRRTDNVLGGTRKVGPDISSRLHSLLTCRDPDMVLGKS